ncbi:DNA-binding response regulator [Romboutsia ilealis]|uniref:Stage 0 sporulation protein A homolog n=1 Tax=Romboutsia faecis TaxID=2764597 RepID=A0ABR7JR72_9FIRM|nr:response regulator transcription factor [Romboutsia faecis]MBC5997422.1 response regulator transcription factor [Romboutsia faecis]MRN24945.1 DNA-binding response regulator [Romboutsia ilealis]
MSLKPQILIVEDEKPIRKFIRVSLETQGYECIESSDGSNAITLVYSMNPDIIILDLGLPDMDGIDVISKIREVSEAKIIVVSARGHEREKVYALDTGADDYLTKPFSVPELLARIRVSLRHKSEMNAIGVEDMKIFEVRGLKINFEKHEVSVDGKSVHLTPIEFKLLELLSKNSGKVLTHRFIINKIWGGHLDTETQSLRVFMASIRRKIEKNPAQPEYIKTEVGVGYKLVDE